MPQSAKTTLSWREGSTIRKVRPRFWAELALGVLTCFLFVLTLVSRDWIEAVFKVDPDQGNGSLEWIIVGVSGVVTVSLFLLARAEWRRAAAAYAAAAG